MSVVNLLKERRQLCRYVSNAGERQIAFKLAVVSRVWNHALERAMVAEMQHGVVHPAGALQQRSVGTTLRALRVCVQ